MPNLDLPLRPAIANMEAYVPGWQPADESRYIKLNTNENPYPPSPRVLAALQQAVGADLRKYPDAGSRRLRQAAAQLYGFEPDWILAANGSDEILNNLLRAFVEPGEVVGFLEPSYSYYATLAAIQGATCQGFAVDAQGRIDNLYEQGFAGKLFFLTNPHAPYGFAYSPEEVARLAQQVAGMLVVDEAYVDFAQQNCLELVRHNPRIVVTRTLSKSYSLAGMRLGLAIAHPQVVAALDKIRDHYHLDRLAQVAGEAALKDQAYLQACISEICHTRDWFRQQLQEMGWQVLPSAANYVFAYPPGEAGEIVQALAAARILVRYFDRPPLAGGIRISIGSPQEMQQLVDVLQTLSSPR